MEVFDRSLTNIPIELHTSYISNCHFKYKSVPEQFVWSGYHVQITIFSRERSSTGSNDCFVVLVVVIFSLFVPCCGPVAHVVPSCGTKSRIANLKV
jgi:hypothetical protein